MRLGAKKFDKRQAALAVLGVSMLAIAVLVEQGFKDAGYYAVVTACVFFNALFLASPLRFIKDWVGLSYLAGLLIANSLLLVLFDTPVLFLLILWLPAIAGVLVGFLVRAKNRKN